MVASTAAIAAAKKRRRGRRGGRNRNRTSASGTRTQAVNTNTVHNDSDEYDEAEDIPNKKLSSFTNALSNYKKETKKFYKDHA